MSKFRQKPDMERCARLASAYDPYPNDPNPPEPTPERFPWEGLAIAAVFVLAALAIGAALAVGLR